MNISLLTPPVQQKSDIRFAARAKGVTQKSIQDAFSAENFSLSKAQVKEIKDLAQQGADLVKKHPGGSTQIGNTAVNIGAKLGFNMMADKSIAGRIQKALTALAAKIPSPVAPRPQPARVIPEWNTYFDKTVNLTSDHGFQELVGKKGFSPVKISWEDIGRTPGSSWGSRISDVGVWVRKDEADPASAQLTLTVRRDGNFRDKVLMVPGKNIKVHTKENGQTVEVSLPERLKQLGLTSKNNDDNVIVSNQFTIVPVPGKDMKGAWKEGTPPRAAFTFSIQPYNSNNFVITDVIEGSSNAVVTGYNHQLLYANVDGEKAPFTASRAEDRADLQKLETELKAKGMDVDIQRYYLIQIPLNKDARIQPANLGEAPGRSGWGGGVWDGGLALQSFAMPEAASFSPKSVTRRSAAAGLGKVAIGHGEKEGVYTEGSGYQGNRAEEPIRVTVSYFVTPKGEITEKDMQAFSKAFAKWDDQAIWGGSFVTPDKK